MYKLRERENTIYASSDDKVSHMSRAGDIDNGKAWRTVRRPSDMASPRLLRFIIRVPLTREAIRTSTHVRSKNTELNRSLVKLMARCL